MSLASVRRALRAQADAEKAAFFPRFFKTGKGEYGEGDRFIGVTVPNIRRVAKEYPTLSFRDVSALLKSPIHEERLLALIILTHQFADGDEMRQKEIYRFYLEHTDRINNWDLVDVSAHKIVGAFLDGKNDKMLDRLAKSKDLWERRIAIVATFHFLHRGDCSKTFRIADFLLSDRHDLIHKAVGWMLREAGKRCSQAELERYLDRHAARMPRTMLRYAIERLPVATRRKYLSAKKTQGRDLSA